MVKSQSLKRKQHEKERFLSQGELLTTEELMTLLKIGHKHTIYKLIRQGMPVMVEGRRYQFNPKAVINFLKRKTKAKFSQARTVSDT